jgi:hypothetical protein
VKKTLVAGWFSFEQMGATAGDLISRDLACDWLREAGRPFDVAHAPPFTGGVDWRTVDPNDYSHVVFVCGPFGNGPPVDEFLERFKGRPLVGLNLTMLDRLENWNPFDLLLERDSSAGANPDMTFASTAPKVPVVGVILIHPQPEYAERDIHAAANAAIHRLIARREVAAVPIDTRLDENLTGLRTPAEVDSLIARMDVVLTTRLHGTVLALKNGVPVVAVDPVAGGAKIRRQAETVGWPMVFAGDTVMDMDLDRALGWCLTAHARAKAAECARQCADRLREVRGRFVQFLRGDPQLVS